MSTCARSIWWCSTWTGNIVEGDLKPSSDTYSHLYIYRHRPDVGGVVHTHSRYATAFAAVGQPIPVVLTAMADEFGGPIPCGGFSLIGDESIGKLVVESIGDSPAVLLKNHGVFTIGKNAEAAVKAAVMTEDVAAHRLAGAATRHARRDPGGRRGEAASSLHACLRAVKTGRLRCDGRSAADRTQRPTRNRTTTSRREVPL